MAIAFDKNLAEGNHGVNGWTTSGNLDTSLSNFIGIGVAFATGSTPSVSDNMGNGTYSARTAYSGAAVAVQLFYKFNPAVGAGHTWTIAGTGIVASMAILTFKTVKTASDPYDQESGSTYFATTPATPGAYTPTNDNSVVLSFLSHNATSPAFTCTGFTIKDQIGLTGGSNYGICSAYVIQTSKTSVNASWADTSGNQGGVDQANFDEPGGAAVIIPTRGLNLQQAVKRASYFVF